MFGKSAGRPNVYPWKEWTDGSVWRVVPGEDFTCTVKTFTTMLYQRARREDMSVTVQTKSDAIQFRFFEEETD